MASQLVQVNKRVKDESEPRHAEFNWDYPDSVAESVERFGEALTLKLIHDSITLDIQAPARKVLEALPEGEDYSAKVAEIMATHTIQIKRSRGPAAPRISPYDQIVKDLTDPEKREALIEKFRSLGINLEMDGTQSSAPRRRV